MSAAPQLPGVVLYVLSSSATDSQLQRIIDFSNGIFGANDSNSHLPAWRNHLDSDERACIIYATTADRLHEDRERREELAGYFFIYPKAQPEVGSRGMHVWMAAVHPDVRGKGVFPSLMAETIRRTVDAGLQSMTICTIPKRFERMYAILQRSGWEFVAWRDLPDCQDTGMKKVLMKMTV